MNIEEQIKCVEREIGQRKRVYPRLVQRETMTERKAQYEIACMEAVLRTLNSLVPERSQGSLLPSDLG